MVVRQNSFLRGTFSLTRFLSAITLFVASVSVWSGAATVHPPTTYPVGVLNSKEPSGMAPPLANAVADYHLTYVTDFNQSHLPRGWYPFTGVAGGDPTDRFSAHHVVVAQGLLRLKTYQDPTNLNAWTTAGLCQCGRPLTYGAVFVRSRQTGNNVNSAELLWPNNNSWPPEIDFNENLFRTNATTATVHWTGNQTDFHVLRIDMSQWHTWGVIWTPTRIVFTVDGRVWHLFSVPSSIPHLPMNVDIEQRVKCPSSKYCPRRPSALLVDWVIEYQRN